MSILAALQSQALIAGARDEPAPKRITMWNKRENRKISGNAAPMEKNIAEYLRKHPECEVYDGQRNFVDPAVRAAQLAAEPRVTIWNKNERRKVSGNAAPLEKNINEYLKKHPECEVYCGQEKYPAYIAPAPVTQLPVTQLPVTQLPVTQLPVTQLPVTQHIKNGMQHGSPTCTLDFLAMVACQGNLDLNHADAYETDGECSDDCSDDDVGGAPMKVTVLGKRPLECLAA